MTKARKITYYTVEIQIENRVGCISRNVASDDALDALRAVAEMTEIEAQMIQYIEVSKHSHEVYYPEV